MVAEVMVTVILPVRDAGQSIDWVLDPLQRQGLDDGALEVLVVDDASREGTAELLDDRARHDASLRVLHLPEPEGMGAARNHGIEEAAGRYLFFLDDATALTEGALGELLGVAEREDSDVVLGRMRGIEGRKAPRAMFGATALDADLVANSVFYTLAPYRLIRRDVVDRSEARFATNLTVGEDQPFMARCYLAARKVSICADRDYVLIRPSPTRPAGPGAGGALGEQVELATQVIDAIEQGTQRGPVRDGVLRRTVRTTISKIISTDLLEESERDRREIVTRLADALEPVWTPGAADHLEPLDRTKVEAALARNPDALARILAWEAREPARSITHDDAGFRPDLPADLVAELGRDRIGAVPATAKASLAELRVEGTRVTVRARGVVEGCAVPADSMVLRLTGRDSEETLDRPAARVRTADLPNGLGLDAEFTVDAADLREGVWDLFLVQRFGEQELPRRLGATRSATVGSDRCFLTGSDRRTVGQTYFTEKYENLSIDRGFVLTKARPRARIVALAGDGDGATYPTVLIRWEALASPRVLARIDGPEGGGGRRAPDQEIASAAVSEDVIAVPLDVSSLPDGASVRLVLATDAGKTVAVPDGGAASSIPGRGAAAVELADDGRIRRAEADR